MKSEIETEYTFYAEFLYSDTQLCKYNPLRPHCSFSSVRICCTAPITPPAPPLAPLYFLFLSPCSASRPSEPSDELHVVQPLGGLPAEPALLGFAPLAVDGAIAHHLRHCPYHLRLLKTWLMSSQELPESLHGQPL